MLTAASVTSGGGLTAEVRRPDRSLLAAEPGAALGLSGGRGRSAPCVKPRLQKGRLGWLTRFHATNPPQGDTR